MATPKILVVEDDPAVSDLIGRYLQRCGYEVDKRVSSGDEALRHAALQRPDLALMDISLPGEMDGVETAQQLRARFEVPVVFLTGRADDETIERSREAKAFGYVLKPFRQEDLKASIDLALSKHKVESKLRQVEQWFTAAIKSIGDAIVTTDDHLVITFLNPAAEALTGWELDDAMGRELAEVFRLRSEVDGDKEWADLSPIAAEFPQSSREAMLIAADAAEVAVEFSSAPVRNDSGLAIGRVFVFRDVTLRRQAEEEVRASREQLRALASHLQAVREEERKRIAREVHDELGQMLTGLKMDLAWIEKRLASIDDPTLRQSLERKAASMFGLLTEMVKSVRRISADLRPGILDDLGLVPAMEWQAREWEVRTGIRCTVVSSLNEALPSSDLATGLFRIFQETLTNVARHAQATAVTASLGLGEDRIVLEIRDNGRGISGEHQRQARSFGILGMKERATLLGGEFNILGSPGNGTTITVQIPLRLSRPESQ